jgi:hypothetical protein
LAYKRRQKGAGYSARAMFTARGFSYSTIQTLAIAGIDAPERLLFATETDLRSIAGIDEKAFQEIAGYRCRFVSADYRPPFHLAALRGDDGVTNEFPAPGGTTNPRRGSAESIYPGVAAARLNPAVKVKRA